MVPPKTPTDRQVKLKFERLQTSLSIIKASRSPSKSPSPRKFLTKGSNVTGYTAWDVDGRVDTIESQFKELKDIVNTTINQKKGDEDALEMAKTRGTCPILVADGV